MRISQASADDVAELARLLWLNHHDEEPAQRSVDAFAAELAQWWDAHRDSHLVFVARLARPEIVGMAWVALVPRPPRPGATRRLSADLQSVYVLPEDRDQGVGAALIEAASQHATQLGCLHVTVHSGPRRCRSTSGWASRAPRSSCGENRASGSVPPTASVSRGGG